MPSIFKIEENLRAIIDRLEENGGEFTEEELNYLKINKDNLKTKLDEYANLVSMYQSDVTCCKDEKKRINDVQKTKENVITRFKNTMLNALIEFGDDGKSGNKIIETSTHKYFTKNTTSVEIDDNKLDTLTILVKEFIRECYNNQVYGIEVPGMEFDYMGALASINALVEKQIDDIDDYTISDLEHSKLTISFDISMLDILCDKAHIIKTLMDNFTVNAEVNKSKDNFKQALETIENSCAQPLTVAAIKKSASLCQK